MNYEKAKLPYEYGRLEPYIDELTVKIHYENHLQSYINNLNRFLAGYDEYTRDKDITAILKDVDSIPGDVRRQVLNNGGEIYNHKLFFESLIPGDKREPGGRFLENIKSSFGSFNNMKEAVSRAAMAHFGAGWAWLVLDEKDNLKVITTSEGSPISQGLRPVLNIDVWEHAYYLKYENRRAEYVKNIWNLFNWNIIEDVYNSYFRVASKI